LRKKIKMRSSLWQKFTASTSSDFHPWCSTNRYQFEVTPDARSGLALLQAAEGWNYSVIDQPGVGRSGGHHTDLGPLSLYTAEKLQSTFTALLPDSWPQANFTRNGRGRAISEILPFDPFYSSQVCHISDYKTAEQYLSQG
jgi:hypothetical protein